MAVSVIGMGSIADLQSYSTTDLSEGDLAIVAGYYSGSQQGGGTFSWDSASMGNDGGVEILPADKSSTSPGRWVRQFSGPVDISWFGARTDLGLTTDEMYAGWVAADAFAALYKYTVLIPSVNVGFWTLKCPIKITCSHLICEAIVNWFPSEPTDFMAAVTLQSDCLVEGLYIVGNDGVPSGPADLMTSGWIKTEAVFTASFSGNTMTVSDDTLTLACRLSISGDGMAPCGFAECTITGPGSGPREYYISISQPTLTGVVVTATKLPYLCAIKAGTVAVRMTSRSIMKNCGSEGTKIGLEFCSPGGHGVDEDGSWGGIFAYFCSMNGQDFKINRAQTASGILGAFLGRVHTMS